MEKKTHYIGTTGLILATFFWGAEFVVEKDVLALISPNYSNAIRFGSASIICTFFLFQKVKKIKIQDIINGSITGIFMGVGFAFQTMGLSTIGAGENALICSAYILIIPLAEWAIFKDYPGNHTFFCAVLVLIGVYLVTYDPDINSFSFDAGELLTLISAFFYTGAIISINYFSSKTDPAILTLIQFYTTTFIALFLALLIEKRPVQFNGLLIVEFIYLIIFATIGAQMLMNFCIKYVSSSAAGMIFSTEFLFAIVLGVIFLKEKTGLLFWIGAALMLGAITFYQYREIKNKQEEVIEFPTSYKIR